MPLDFLQRDDVGALDLVGDARKIVAAVLAEPVLDVVGDELHRLTLTASARGRATRFDELLSRRSRVSAPACRSPAPGSVAPSARSAALRWRALTRDSTLSTSFSPTSMTPSITVLLPIALKMETSSLLAAPSIETTSSLDSDSQRQDIAVIVLVRLVGDAFALQRLVRITAADMHDERRVVLETREASLERLRAPMLAPLPG